MIAIWIFGSLAHHYNGAGSYRHLIALCDLSLSHMQSQSGRQQIVPLAFLHLSSTMPSSLWLYCTCAVLQLPFSQTPQLTYRLCAGSPQPSTAPGTPIALSLVTHASCGYDSFLGLSLLIDVGHLTLCFTTALLSDGNPGLNCHYCPRATCTTANI